LKVLVTGASGLVGRATTEYCATQGDEVLGYDHQSLDISNPASVRSTLQENRPQVVINCAAWTDVDACESDQAHAQRANAFGPELLANACREIDALLITISTDYVFDGTKQGFYTQGDEPNPISVYGHSKLEGERRAQAAWGRTIIVRSGYIFGAGGKNFLSTLLPRAARHEPLRAISDMVGTPTYAPDLAWRMRELADLDLPGVFHVVNGGDGASFETFARTTLEIAGLASVQMESVLLADLHRPAPRPRNSRLRCLRSEALHLDPLPHWTDALNTFVNQQRDSQSATV
jgi:dTDP-4-dehydrorhamnose reductase